MFWFVFTEQGKIPANSTLVFEVELFDWTGEDVSEDKDGSIIKRIIEAGEGFENPTEDSTVQGTYTAVQQHFGSDVTYINQRLFCVCVSELQVLA